MTLTDIIAVAALIVSLVSPYLSKKATDQARDSHQESQRNLVESAKADLLALMADCNAVLIAARTEAGAVKAVFDAEPEPVKRLLVNYTSLSRNICQRSRQH